MKRHNMKLVVLVVLYDVHTTGLGPGVRGANGVLTGRVTADTTRKLRTRLLEARTTAWSRFTTCGRCVTHGRCHARKVSRMAGVTHARCHACKVCHVEVHAEGVRPPHIWTWLLAEDEEEGGKR